MKTAKLIVILIVSVFLGSAALLLSIKYEPEKKSVRRMIAEEEVKIQWLYYQLAANQVIYSVVPAIAGLACLLLSGAFGLAIIRKQSVYHARIGEHSDIPVHYSDLRDFYPIAVNLSLAEIEASVSNANEKAFQISDSILKSISSYSRVGKPIASLPSQPEAPALSQGVPTFSELLAQGMIAPGKPLVMGFTQEGMPQLREPNDFKSCAIAGFQGSGKTLSVGFILTSIVYQYPTAKIWVLDPHWKHEESLVNLISPLESTGKVQIVNPIDTRKIIAFFKQTLDDRLEGKSPSEPPLFFVVDEMAKLAKSLEKNDFDLFINFLEETTESTRKANITFFGISQKWNARHFKNRKDIRDCMPSLLVHKSKPSQAELLIDGMEKREKQLVKTLKQPGECLLATSHDADPQIVRMPLITRQDIQEIVRMIGNDGMAANYSTQNAPQPQSAIEIRNARETTQKREETGETPFFTSVNELRETVVSWIETGQETVSGLANKIDMNKGQLYRFTKGESPSEALHTALSTYSHKWAETP